ncbi:hypothetical protein Dda3937_04355 [Dickeya dadantii 3937]|uniref:Uncharacterized protein n=1 Tax=Dickeya dadantii (strain 3937) TaxID=198628 RepID=E0SKE7_DICD3|nr:hypothetical protein Dda3937_04355 [Dickeya dadantii 3937]
MNIPARLHVAGALTLLLAFMYLPPWGPGTPSSARLPAALSLIPVTDLCKPGPGQNKKPPRHRGGSASINRIYVIT